MDDFLEQDKVTLEYYIRKYCPFLPKVPEYIETKLKPILESLANADPEELEGQFWPCFNDKYDRMFITVIEKKSLSVKKCIASKYDYEFIYPVADAEYTGYLVQEPADHNDYFEQAAVIMDDLYKSAYNLNDLDVSSKKKVLMNLMRYIDSQRTFVEKTWPKSTVTDELLQNLQDKYDAYDELYDELAMCALV